MTDFESGDRRGDPREELHEGNSAADPSEFWPSDSHVARVIRNIIVPMIILVITIIGIAFIAMLGMEYGQMKSRTEKAEVLLETIEKRQDTLGEVVQVAEQEYPAFYSTFLQLQLWKMIQGFSVNCDPKSIADTRSTIKITREFFRAETYRQHKREEIRSLAAALHIADDLISCQVAINGLPDESDDVWRRIATLVGSSTPRKSLKDNLMDISRRAERELIHKHHEHLKVWFAGVPRLLIWRHKLDADSTVLMEAEAIFMRGLAADSVPDRYKLDSQLRTKLAMVHSDFAKYYREQGVDTSYQRLRLEQAVGLLQRSIDLSQAWDSSIYNAMADYQTRLFLLKDSAPSDLVGEAEANIERAIIRDPGVATYRVTLFEIRCLQHAIHDSAQGDMRSDVEVPRLRGYLDDIFSLSYNDFYHDHLFGVLKQMDDSTVVWIASDMMRTLLRSNKPVFEELKEAAEENKRRYRVQ